MIHSGYTNGILIALGSMAAAVMLVLIGRRLFSPEARRQAHDLTGNMVAIVGTFYAVLLGLIVVEALVRFETALDGVQVEANCLADIHLLAQRLPEPHRTAVRGLCREYVVRVIEHEWPAMQRSEIDTQARQTVIALTRSLDAFEPATEAEKAVYPELLDELRQLWHQRRERGNTVEFGMPVVQWVVLIVGCVVTVFFIGLFFVENTWLQLLVAALTALVIALNIYLIVLFVYPFSGELSVSEKPFRVDLEIFDGFHDATGDGRQTDTLF